MIYCIECQFNDWAHQEVNSGIIQQIAMAFPKTRICVIADKSHNDVLKQYYYSNEVRFMNYCMDKVKCSVYGSDEKGDILSYVFSLNKLFDKLKLSSGDRIVILAANRGIMIAVGLLSIRYRHVNFYCVFHMLLEKVIDNGMRKESEKFISLKNAINLSVLNKNVHLLVYSPTSKKYLKGKICNSILKRTFFIHLPVLQPEEGWCKNKEESNDVCVAAWGAAVNDRTKKVIAESLRQIESEQRCGFLLLDRSTVQYNFQDSRILVIRKSTGFTETEIRDAIARADWVLIPYSDEEYKATASGICADAIRYGKPIIALDSPYIQWYNQKYNIGYVEGSVELLIERIKQLIENSDKGEEFWLNLYKARKKMVRYNIKKISEIMK